MYVFSRTALSYGFLVRSFLELKISVDQETCKVDLALIYDAIY
jgi:hypothetical protein